MGVLSTGGDGSAWVKYDNGNVAVGAGDTTRLTVDKNGSHSLVGGLSASGDLNVNGGLVHAHQFFSFRVLQGTTPLMTSSIVDFSGTAAQGNSTRVVFTRVPLPKAGSVVGVSLLTQNCTVKSGSLSGTVFVNGTATAATVGMNTGTLASNTFAKDLYTFNANSYVELQLTASSGYLTDTDPTSGSFMGLVLVEY